MALRTSSLPASTAAPAPTDWRRRLELALSVAARRLAENDLDGLAAVYADVTGWDDVQRRYQARCRLTELVLGHLPATPDGWVGPFFTATGAVLAALEQEPREPVLLNHAGVMLYEMFEAGAAADLFKAVLRLDPQHPHARANLDQARARTRSQSRLPGAFGTRTRPLADRARKVAARAKAEKGLTLSLCMIVKDEEEMLPGCLEPLRGFVDEMIVVDTGSSDRTVEIAESFGARVVDFPWNGSFADARNASIEAATGDWIMYLDADEHMEAERRPRPARPARAHVARGLLPHRDQLHRRCRGRLGRHPHGAAGVAQPLALPVRRPHPRAEDAHHADVPAERFETTRIRVRHYGYLNQRIALKDKSRRNIELLAAGGARVADAVHRLQPRLGVPRRCATSPMRGSISTAPGTSCASRACSRSATRRCSSPALPAPAAR